jgi:hypothetical protein
MNIFLILCISSISILKSYVINNNPIILIPGLGSSRLIKDKIDIWPPKINYFLWNYKEWEKNMIVKNINGEMIYDKTVKTLPFGDKKSLDLHANIPFIIRKNFYDNILNEYKDIFPTPYDFRLIHSKDYRNTYYLQLEKYIESFNKPLILLTHSSGGLLCHNFLLTKSHEWRNKYIKSVINVNVPFGGTLISLHENIVDTNLNVVVGKKIIRTIGGFIINFPNIKFLDKVLTVNDNIINDYLSYFKLDDLKILYDENTEFINSFSESTGIKTHIIYTSKAITLESFNINNDKIEFKYGLGDGIVPLKSLLVPKIWNSKEITFIDLPNLEHSSILFSEKLKEIINNI